MSLILGIVSQKVESVKSTLALLVAREYGVAKARGYDLRTMSPFFHSASFVLRLLVLCFFS
jgi:hypothetical protein